MMCEGTGILEDVNEEDCDYSLSPPVYDPGKNFE
jgi:hypothetical protein